MSFDLNGLQNGTTKFFEKTLKLMQIFQILGGGMNFWERLHKTKRPQQERAVLTLKSFFILGRYQRVLDGWWQKVGWMRLLQS